MQIKIATYRSSSCIPLAKAAFLPLRAVKTGLSATSNPAFAHVEVPHDPHPR